MDLRNAIQKAASKITRTAGPQRVFRGVTLELDEEETGEFAKALPNAGRYLFEKIKDGVSIREGQGIGVWWTTDRRTAEGYAEAMVIYMNGSSRFGVVITAEVNEEDMDDPSRGFTDQYPVVMLPGAPVQVVNLEVNMPPGDAVLDGWKTAYEYLEQPQLPRSVLRPMSMSPMRTVAMPGWRNKANGPFWMDYDAVIAPEWTPRGNNYEVWAKQEIIGTAHSLADAKAIVERKYGPQTWRVEKMVPYLDLDAPLGPTEEFTSPKRIYVVDFLAKTAAFGPSIIRSWTQTQPWNLSREAIEAGEAPGVRVGNARGTEDASFENGSIVVKEQWFSRPIDVRKAILYHEAGHGLESAIGLRGLVEFGVDDPLDLINWPGASGLGHNASEVLAEAYAVVWTEPQWFNRMKAGAIRTLVTDMAQSRGYPLP